jgi:leader peptidase (prepilin peptidase) / N-methyltransferase
MEAALTFVFVLLGAVIGSFLNVCVDRLPARKSLAYPPSACDSCGHHLSPIDLVPVLSWLALRGRCRYCRAHIPWRVPLVEALTATLFAIAFRRYGLSAQFIVVLAYMSVFVVIMFIDLEHQLILNVVVYPAAIAAIVLLAVDSLAPRSGVFGDNLIYFAPPIVSGFIAGLTAAIFFLAVIYLSRGGMGMGDAKTAGLIGLVCGFPLTIIAVFIGILAGGVTGMVLLAVRKAGRKTAIPFGPFLSIGAIVTLLWGNQLFFWYLEKFVLH